MDHSSPAKPTGVPSYRPIRARIQESLEAPDDAEMVTDVAMMLAAIAHDKQDAYLAHWDNDMEIMAYLVLAEDLWADEIAAIKTVSHALDAHGRAGGFSKAESTRWINTKMALELFESPALARYFLFGDAC